MKQRLINYAALQVLKRSQWRNKFDPDLRFDVDPFDYDDVDDYLDDLREAWKNEVDPYDDFEDYVDVSDFIDFSEYEEAVEEYKNKQALKDHHDPDDQYEIDLDEFEDEDDLLDKLREQWKEELDSDDEFENYVNVNDYTNYDDYREAIQSRKENLAWKEDFYGTDKYGVDIDDYDEKEDFLEALKEAWKEEYDPSDEFNDIDPEEYDSDEDYAYAVKMESWKKELDPGNEFDDINPEDYDSYASYAEAIKKSLWKQELDSNEDFDYKVDPMHFESKDDYAKALKAEWKNEYDYSDDFPWIKSENYDEVDDYAEAIESAQEKKEWQESHDSYNETNISPYGFESEEDYLKALHIKWKELYDPNNLFISIDPSNYENIEDYSEEIEEASENFQALSEEYPYVVYTTNPYNYDNKQDYLDALLKEAERKVETAHIFWDIKREDFNSEEDYENALKKAQKQRSWKIIFDSNNYYNINPYEYDSLDDYCDALNNYLAKKRRTKSRLTQ